MWRKAWADISNAYLERAGSPERIDHRSNAERGIGEIPTVHMGVAACQMEKKGIATEKGELNRNIQKANRLIREIRAQIGKLKELLTGEKCACVLLDDMHITQPTLSHHMKILCDSGIVIGRKEGKWMHYSISENGVQYAIDCLQALMITSAAFENKSCCDR